MSDAEALALYSVLDATEWVNRLFPGDLPTGLHWYVENLGEPQP